MSGFYSMMTLGGFAFGIDTAAYQELKRTSEYSWPSQQRFGSTPAVQFVGKGDETISLPGVIYPEWNGGTGQLDDLRALADGFEPLLMMDGRGNVMGRWVIDRVEEAQENFAEAGVARKQQFTLSLKKFDDLDPASGLAIPLLDLALDQFPASLSALPSVPNTLSPLSSAADMLKAVTGTAQAALTTAGRLATNISSAVTDVARIANSLGVHAPAITNALNRSQAVSDGLRASANSGLSLMGRVQTAASAASAVRSLFSDSTNSSRLAERSSSDIKSSLVALQGGGAAPDVLATVTGAMVSANKVTSLVSALTDNTNTIIQKIGA